ncbi:UDP-N-acetylmuramoyl-tripeptide--D-alanyl-D-alanine ligase [Corynebacterium caspium]|uniref:UDP-N-acetylmuramoyl-tripeptide--D-alanyl-D- alanine ligase n=1 Tax=Corynebacterium caspium TaxID=234828 RepID=UPI00036BF308|nr:UDP-N-acetylmuramoyl-tripeptide--D-alanyl-D-alanine ligase [Corynebacterium caspium]WKD58992.1 UDP-N-acetylmuramoyl-tripeptide--D-alanyl-D-alanine ligase [Corynebacterium caspium DSM 44850]
MLAMSLGEIARVIGGQLIDGADPNTVITGTVEFDSRKITPGSLFLALPGARVDGHDFASQAVTSGAVAAIVAQPVGVPAILVPHLDIIVDSNSDIYNGVNTQVMASLLAALSKLAHYVVEKQRASGKLKVIGVTGSAGKTSTKDMLATVLSDLGPTIAPPGSFNNEIGLPYTALRITDETNFLVAEMSARGLGHISYLADITPPDIGVVLNIGTAHLGEFGSQETIAQAKGELVEALPKTGIAILNADDAEVVQMKRRTGAAVKYFSTTNQADIQARNIILNDAGCASFELIANSPLNPLSATVNLQVSGLHQVSNALAAAAVAYFLGLPLDRIAAALSQHRAISAHRMDIRQHSTGFMVIDDAYNANPDSMAAGLQALQEIVGKRQEKGVANARAIAVLGDMGELGEAAISAHEKLGASLAGFGVSSLVAVGESVNVQVMVAAAQEQGVFACQVPDTSQAAAVLGPIIDPAAVVFVKASNAARLWDVADRLMSLD